VKNVCFTSFQRSHALACPLYSVAVQWPRGYEHIPRVEWALILDSNGKWIRPREFLDQVEPLAAYRAALMAQYESRIFQAKLWLDAQPDSFAMLCWCPYDRAAQRQLEEHGTFVCHTGVLAEFMERRLDCQVWLDGDRRRMKALG
jgi:hypothetical protein